VKPDFDSFDPAPYFLHFTNPNLDGATGGMGGVSTLFSVPDLVHTQLASHMGSVDPNNMKPAADECAWYDVACKTTQGVKGALAFGAVLVLSLLLVYVGFEFVVKDSGAVPVPVPV
jgi:hypothetical protein